MKTMTEMLEICRAGHLDGRDAQNPYFRSSNYARAFTAGVILGQRGVVPTGCRPSRGHTLRVKAGTVEYKIDFGKSETAPTITTD